MDAEEKLVDMFGEVFSMPHMTQHTDGCSWMKESSWMQPKRKVIEWRGDREKEKHSKWWWRSQVPWCYLATQSASAFERSVVATEASRRMQKLAVLTVSVCVSTAWCGEKQQSWSELMVSSQLVDSVCAYDDTWWRRRRRAVGEGKRDNWNGSVVVIHCCCCGFSSVIVFASLATLHLFSLKLNSNNRWVTQLLLKQLVIVCFNLINPTSSCWLMMIIVGGNVWLKLKVTTNKEVSVLTIGEWINDNRGNNESLYAVINDTFTFYHHYYYCSCSLVLLSAVWP